MVLSASTLKEAYLLGIKLMMNAVRKGWVFSRRKACISNSVTFCGLDLKADKNHQVTIMPEINRITALTELPIPSTRKEAQSLISLLVSFSKWIHGLAKMMSALKQATTPHSHFTWTPDMQHELVHIRQVVNDLLPLAPFNAKHSTYLYGFGCVLMQDDDLGKFIMAASTGVTPAMTWYSVYELEMTALA